MPRPTVFISSTIEDLPTYREAARDAALRAGFFPMMQEYWAAEANEPLDVCLRRVEAADVLVVLSAHRYGWTPPDQPSDGPRKSITWLECLHAGQCGIDLLAFLLDDKHPWRAELREEYRFAVEGPAGRLTPARITEIQQDVTSLREFRQFLKTGRVVGFFTSPQDLMAKVEAALREWLIRHPDRMARAEPAKPGQVQRPQDYLQVLCERNGTIDIRGLQVGSGRASRFAIDELYIPLTTMGPRGEMFAGGKDGAPEPGERRLMEMGGRIELDAALENRCLAIIGDPGAGKSTFLRRIAFLLARVLLEKDPSAVTPPLGLDGLPSPLLITVASLAEHIASCLGRDDAPATAESPAWLAHYAGTWCHEENIALDEAYFRQRLEDGGAIVLVDGLDEASSDRDRHRVAKVVERAAEAFRDCRFVLTSRPAAYQRAAVLPGFAMVKIEPLEDSAIEHFLDRWCRALFADSPSQVADHRDELLLALRSRPEIRRLARNPVMLTALAVVHWHEKRLPEQRADLYESILDWLARSRENRPDRPSAERCIALLQKLALAMLQHPQGRQTQVPRHWAAEQIADDFREVAEDERHDRARLFLIQEELDSGIVVGRTDDIRFWHLTFLEYLAARAIAAQRGDVRANALFASEKIHSSEWRETVLLLAGVLYHQGIDRVDAMAAAILDTLGKRPKLPAQARVAGLLGAVVADLSPVAYQPRDPRYRETLDAVMAIFQPDSPVPIEQAIAAAEALGQAGDPRFAPRQRKDNWITIPEGEFWMGAQANDPSERNYDPEAYEWEAPVHRVRLSSYRIARYPVTVGEYREFVEHDGYRKEEFWSAGGFGKFSQPEGWEEQLQHPTRPVVGVSWFEAAAYAAWAGAQLPTEAQWERAARGPEHRRYPWGDDDPDATRMNYTTGKWEDPASWKPNVGRPTPVGIYPRGDSPEGLCDMAGNVWEWCQDRFGDYDKAPAENHSSSKEGERRVVRGGGWPNLPRFCRCSYRLHDVPHVRDDSLGFRVLCVGVVGQDS